MRNLIWLLGQDNGNASEIIASYSYKPTHTYPLPMPVSHWLSGVSGSVISASENVITPCTYDIISTLTVSNVSVLDGTNLHCKEILGSSSDKLSIEISSRSNSSSILFYTFHYVRFTGYSTTNASRFCSVERGSVHFSTLETSKYYMLIANSQ